MGTENLLRIVFIAVLVKCVICDVRLPPSIIDHPESVTYRTEDRVTLKCIADGEPRPEFSWKKNEEELDLSESNIHTEGNSGTIVIEPATLFDEGYYQCSAKNQHGIAVSNVAAVLRANLDTSSDTSIQEYPASVGEPLMLKCEYGNTYPKPVVTWAVAESVTDENPKNLPLTSRIQTDLEGNLHFMNIETSDSQLGKIYKCQVKNRYLDLIAGVSYSQIRVNPGSPPFTRPKTLYTPDASEIALLDKEIVLKCLFSGYPTPRITWSRKDGQLPPGRYQISSSDTTLTIRNLTWSDEGRYECLGVNDVDATPYTFDIDVQSVPVFKKDPSMNNQEMKPVNLNKTEKQSASFLCKTDAEPVASIQWYVNGDEISSTDPGPGWTITDGSSNFTVHDLCKDCEDNDLIVVQCNASNKHGYAYAQGYLNVLKRTELTLIPTDVNMGTWEEEVLFECDAKTDDSTPLTLIWKHDGVQVDPSKQPEYTLVGHNLLIDPTKETDPEEKSKIAGKYTCEANNGYSMESASAYLTLPPVDPPIVAKGGFNILDYWWVFLIIVLIILIILLILLCYICYQRNKGDEYPVDEKDRKNGYDPEKELADSGFHDFQRPEEMPFKGSRASLTSTIKLDTDDEASLLEYGEPDTGKFNEDGSFIGQYHDKSRRYNDSTV